MLIPRYIDIAISADLYSYFTKGVRTAGYSSQIKSFRFILSLRSLNSLKGGVYGSVAASRLLDEHVILFKPHSRGGDGGVTLDMWKYSSS